MGKLVFHSFGALAELERAVIRKRLDEGQRRHAMALYRSRKRTVKAICALMGISCATLSPYVDKYSADGAGTGSSPDA